GMDDGIGDGRMLCTKSLIVIILRGVRVTNSSDIVGRFSTWQSWAAQMDALAGWKTCPTGSARRYTIALAFRPRGRYAHWRRHWKAIRPFAGAIMTIQAIRTGFFAAVLLLVTPLAADPVPAPSSGAPVEDAGAALAREAQIVIDAILDHH